MSEWLAILSWQDLEGMSAFEGADFEQTFRIVAMFAANRLIARQWLCRCWWINSQSSRSIFGRPTLFRDFHRQDANEELFQAERPGPRQAGLATVGPPKPATPGHCYAVEDETTLAVAPSARATNNEMRQRLDADQAWRHFLEKRYDVTTLQLPTNNQVAFSINAMDLKDRLRNIETDCRDRLHV